MQRGNDKPKLIIWLFNITYIYINPNDEPEQKLFHARSDHVPSIDLSLLEIPSEIAVQTAPCPKQNTNRKLTAHNRHSSKSYLKMPQT